MVWSKRPCIVLVIACVPHLHVKICTIEAPSKDNVLKEVIRGQRSEIDTNRHHTRVFLAVPWVCLQFVIAVFPDHTHLLFWCSVLFFIYVPYLGLSLISTAGNLESSAAKILSSDCTP